MKIVTVEIAKELLENGSTVYVACFADVNEFNTGGADCFYGAGLSVEEAKEDAQEWIEKGSSIDGIRVFPCSEKLGEHALTSEDGGFSIDINDGIASLMGEN